MKSKTCGRAAPQKQTHSLAGAVIGVALFSIITSALARPRDPSPPFPEFAPVLYCERFDEAFTRGETKAEIVISDYGNLVESWSGYALQRTEKTPPFIVPGIDSAGRTNIAAGETASLRLWLKPYWTSQSLGGNGPGNLATLVELAAVGEKQTETVWSLRVSPDGEALVFFGQSDAGPIALFKVGIGWEKGAWHQVCLTYGSRTKLFIDGKLVAESGATLAVPAKAAALAWGSAIDGSDSFGGEIDELYSFARPLEVAFGYSALKGQAVLGPVTPAEELALAELRAKAKAEREASGVGGGAQLRLLVGPTSSCNPEVPVHITNIVSILVSTQSCTVQFDIQGSYDGTTTPLYDVFTATNLIGGHITNSFWTWLERGPTCSTYEYTNQPDTHAYYILGTPKDSDFDGLTDAYEQLISKTDPKNPDTDNDGLSDDLELSLGMNPHDPYSQDGTDTYKDGEWYLTAREGQSGKRAELTWVDSFYSGGITYLLFAVSAGSNDQHHIYIQTPSIDSTDTNLVWQDMFFNFGFNYGGYDPNTGIHLYETAWWGNVTNATFAALDSQDRDFDGLQDGYEIFSTHTVAGAPSSDGSGVGDGDAELHPDRLSSIQKWQYGLNPLTAASTVDSVGDYMPDWFRDYVTVWYGSGAAVAAADPDSDGVPNVTEFDTGNDPTIPDNWSYLPPPSGDQFVSLQFTMPYSETNGPYFLDTNSLPHGNEYFANFGLSAGPLGLGVGMGVLTSGPGPGTANFQFEIWPLDQSYYVWSPFSDNADPAQGEFQNPDPADADLYRNILFESTQLAKEVWSKINKDVLESLSYKTLEHIRAVSVIRIHQESRRIQYYQYLLAQGANETMILIRIKRSASIVHTEITKITAIDLEYVKRYPNLNWLGRGLRMGSYAACGASWYYSWPDLMDYIREYKRDVRDQVNFGAADILSSQIQSMLQDLPFLPTPVVIALNPTVPILSLNGPLGWYSGY